MNSAKSHTSRSYLTRMTILNLVKKYRSVPRKDIATMMDVRPTTISDLSRELIEEGILCESGSLPGAEDAGSGKRNLQINPHFGRIIGIDIKVNEVEAIVTDFCGAPLYSRQFPVGKNDTQEEILRTVFRAVDDAANEAGREQVLGIGVSTIGVIDRSIETVVLSFANLSWSHINIAKKLSGRYPEWPVFVEDVAVCRLQAEELFGDSADGKNAIYIECGDVLGCSMYYNGQIFRNEEGICGEIGHFSMSGEEGICVCGNTGCLSTVASSEMIVRTMKDVLRNGTYSVLSAPYEQSPDQITIEMILGAAEQGDRAAVSILTKAASSTGRGISHIINLLGFKEVILGGILAETSDLYFHAMEEEARRCSLSLIADSVRIERTAVRECAAARGAAGIVIEEYFKMPDLIG